LLKEKTRRRRRNPELGGDGVKINNSIIGFESERKELREVGVEEENTSYQKTSRIDSRAAM